MNTDSNNQQAANDIFGAYKRKEYGWFAFYIALVVIASRLGGVVGAVVSVLVVAGLYKTLKNPGYSTTRKTLLSILYAVGGVIVAYLAAILFVGVSSQFAGDRTVDSLSPEFQAAQSRSLSDEPFMSNSTPQLTQDASVIPATANLENTSYVDSKYKFRIKYPKGSFSVLMTP